jgi:hypothetical protein
MTAGAFVGSFWPSERQKLLLRAALLEDQRAAQAWDMLRLDFDVEELELGEHRLLPLVYHRLRQLGLDDPALPKLRGLYRRTWYLNQVLLDRLKEALRAVEERDVEALVVNSWELPVRYYRDLGLRAVEQLHLLVRPGRVSGAARALAEAGWSGPLEPSEAFLRGRHSAAYTAENGDVCVLNWRLFPEYSAPGLVEPTDLFESAITFELGGVPARALSPSDEMLDICISGARMSHWSNLVWIADALAVLRAPDITIDWGRLCRQARRLRATLPLREALAFLRHEFECDVPDEVLDELQSTPRRRELLAHRLAATRLGPLGPMPATVTRFLRLTADKNLPRALGSLPSFVRDEWGLERRSQIPLAAFRRATGVVRAAVRVGKQKRARRTSQASRAAAARES